VRARGSIRDRHREAQLADQSRFSPSRAISQRLNAVAKMSSCAAKALSRLQQPERRQISSVRRRDMSMSKCSKWLPGYVRAGGRGRLCPSLPNSRPISRRWRHGLPLSAGGEFKRTTGDDFRMSKRQYQTRRREHPGQHPRLQRPWSKWSSMRFKRSSKPGGRTAGSRSARCGYGK
jgi:hypothetical protein